MLLSAEQQERYSRHLILDGFGGEGQERLLQASIHVAGTGPAALWCARYLAASGVGGLQVDVPQWEDELRQLGPWLRLGGVPGVQRVQVSPQGGPAAGAQAAVDVVRDLVRK